MTDRVVLFHSASGKDSIALLDLMQPYFREIVCVYMYVVKNLKHINRYLNYSVVKYPNARFVQIPHYVVFSYIKYGYMGMEKNPNQKQYGLAQLTDMVRERYDIGWAFFGFKQTDSMNRRLMLRTYENNSINRLQRKCYPLSEYKNSDVMRYIHTHGLVIPESYDKRQSCGTDITDINYLLYLRNQFPADLQKVLNTYPLVERILYEYDYKANQAK